MSRPSTSLLLVIAVDECLDARDVCAKTRGACHRAALRADPLAL
jgi:hypothetical protein